MFHICYLAHELAYVASEDDQGVQETLQAAVILAKEEDILQVTLPGSLNLITTAFREVLAAVVNAFAIKVSVEVSAFTCYLPKDLFCPYLESVEVHSCEGQLTGAIKRPLAVPESFRYISGV